MVVYAVRTKHSRAVEDWLEQTKERSRDDSLLKNPFKMRFRRFNKKQGLILAFDVQPLYPNFTVFGWLVALAVFVIAGPIFWVWPGIVLGMFGFFWTSEFFCFMTRLGIKRAGYSGPIKRIKLSKLIEEVMF